ncbi:YaiO family outer membrane beta-barrel protein [Flavobacterium sp. TAB 87]|uniref:YaiO family outer membrane beta-barrel protein n=1 Tax=Flavobacterium sp. TAB 87 TaxID=1729581 RepID=UPI00076C7FB5|nr:YaiO family outer membrane beta-barrel protein [Flavobacterium sp. TAB 87]KVV15125.1 putative PEP-CTERM system TPR-repeat lipoprotein [Flavobacterium sp. TAB 87]
MKKYFSFLLVIVISFSGYGQESDSSDELFQKARTVAFDQKDYVTAIALSKQALLLSPEYTDISIFLGRLYTWTDNWEAARVVFKDLDLREVQDEDYFVAYASLEYWNDQNEKAIEIIDKGLKYNPRSETLWLLKAKVYNGVDNYAGAQKSVDGLLAINSTNTEARELSVRLNELTSKNQIGLTYNLSHFDKQFDDDWHIMGLSYKRNTKYGSVILKGNFANKFASNGTQVELEAYPKLSKIFYMYVGAGYSNDVGIFPKYRTGASLNANLPRSFEAEIGYRHLYFSENLFLYTASVGKYYKNYWFNLRTYITPDSKNISQSYTGTVRYYTKGADDYFAFQIGTGISPEDYRSNLLENYTYKLKTFKMGAEYNFSIKKVNIFSVGAMYFNQEYQPQKKGNQYDLSLGYSRRF